MTEPTGRPTPLIDEEAIPAVSAAEERISVATQWQLMWWRFKKHRLAMVSTAVVLLFYLVVIFAD
ncbi:MAG: ABC transporter permease, partial [Zetaproteobacteria bacterium]